jgi:hypothetical protein
MRKEERGKRVESRKSWSDKEKERQNRDIKKRTKKERHDTERRLRAGG